MKHIALDLDGTLAHTIHSLYAFIEAELGCKAVEDPDRYHAIEARYPEPLRPKVLELIRAAFDHNAGNVYGLAPVLPGAHTGAWKLTQGGHLAAYVTRRPPSCIPVSEAWLKRHGFPLAPVSSVAKEIGKAEVMDHLGCHAIVEDSGHEAQEIASAGLQVYLIDQPYNRDMRRPDVHRVQTVLEAAALFLGGQA